MTDLPGRAFAGPGNAVGTMLSGFWKPDESGSRLQIIARRSGLQLGCCSTWLISTGDFQSIFGLFYFVLHSGYWQKRASRASPKR